MRFLVRPIMAWRGLTSQQAAERQRVSGRNALKDNKRHPIRMALLKLWGPVPWMLEAAIVRQLVTREYAEAGVVTGLLLFNGALGYVQQARAATTLDTLTSKLALEASVSRDGAWQTIPAADLVLDDLVALFCSEVRVAPPQGPSEQRITGCAPGRPHPPRPPQLSWR